MPYFQFQWTDEIVAHFSEHEQVLWTTARSQTNYSPRSGAIAN